MKRLIFLGIVFLISVQGFCQPKAISKGGSTSVSEAAKETIGGKYVTDTLNVFYIVEDAEGYLKKVTGKLISKSFVNDYGAITVIEQTRIDSKGSLIKPESVYDIKLIPSPPQLQPVVGTPPKK